MRHHPFPWR